MRLFERARLEVPSKQNSRYRLGFPTLRPGLLLEREGAVAESATTPLFRLLSGLNDTLYELESITTASHLETHHFRSLQAL